MAEIENLSITVAASADEAYVAFDRLISKLNRTKIELKAFAAGAVVSALKEIKSNASAAASALNRFANAQERVNRAMGGFTGAGYTSTMRGAASDANTATNAIMRFVNAMATAQNAMQRMRYANASMQQIPQITGQVQEPIYTEFVDDAEDMGNAIEETGEQVERTRRNLDGFWNAVRGVSAQIGGGFIRAIRAGIGVVGGFIRGLARIAMFRIYRTLVKDLGQSFKDLYGWSDMFGNGFADSMDKITTAAKYLGNSIAAMAAPLINALAPALDFIIDKIVDVLNWFNQLFAVLAGQDTYVVAKKVAVSFGDAIDTTTKKSKKKINELKRTILGFDEINKLQAPKNNSGSGSGSSPYSTGYETMFEERKVGGGFKGFSDALERSLDDSLSRIALIVSGATLAVGAILAFSGINIPLGIGMMAAGITGIAATLNWNATNEETKKTLKTIALIAGAATVALGMLFAFSGANIPLGIGMMLAGIGGIAATLDWNALKSTLTGKIGAIVAAAALLPLAIGAVLAFSGANIPLGIGLMALGAGTLGGVAALNWDALKSTLTGKIGAIVAAAALLPLAIGAVLAFSGANIPLGIGLMAAGALTLGGIATLNWDMLKSTLTGKIGAIVAAAALLPLAIGAVLAFSGANIPLGIGLMALGAGTLTGVAVLNWDMLKTTLTGKIGAIVAAAALLPLAIGAVLAFSGANIPLGIGLMALGAGTLGGVAALNWNAITELLSNPFSAIALLVGTGLTVIGALLAFSGANIPLGIGMLLAGIATTAATLNWQSLKELMEENFLVLMGVVGGVPLLLGAIFAFSGVDIPLGIGLMLLGLTTTGAVASLNWDAISNLISGPVATATAIVSGATLVLGIIALLCGLTPLGLGLILAGAAGLATTIAANWDNLVQLGKDAIEKVKEGWDTLKEKAFELKAKIVTKAKDLWSKLQLGWSIVKDKVVGFSVKVKDKAEDLWDKLKGDWALVNDKVVEFSVKVKETASAWWQSVKKLWDDFTSGDPERVLKAKLTIANTISSLWEDVKKLWNETVETLKVSLGFDNIKLPHFYLNYGKVDLGVLGTLNYPKSIGVNWYAKGGILDGAQLFGMMGNKLLGGGEAGREAVLPLESNTEWMDTLSERIYKNNREHMQFDSGYSNEEEISLMQMMVSEMRSMLAEMRRLNEKEFTAEITTSDINRAQSRMNRRAGTTIVPVGN